MNIPCYLISNGKFEKAVMPQKLLLDLLNILQNKGKETVHFPGRSIEVEGVYVPGKGSKTMLMCLGDADEKGVEH
ncbi:hypothetical protein [Sutcliffiella sp. FSL R7-0096]|uniref:hypothetical protein n=1 Tax=Sutcliffiella sp. FSL R7-0096 TaxID=2921670 RepID=UPI00315B3E55